MRDIGTVLVFVAVLTVVAMHYQSTAEQSGQTSTTTLADVDRYVAGWKTKPKEAALVLLTKYGPPQEATPNRLIWHDNGPWKFTEIVDEEIPHDFPLPHVDFLYQAIAHHIAPEHAELLAYDGSLFLDRTKGELGARCDREEPNFLAINLAHDIITKKRGVENARKFYAESMLRLIREGKPNEYLTGFRFRVAQSDEGDRDAPNMTNAVSLHVLMGPPRRSVARPTSTPGR